MNITDTLGVTILIGDTIRITAWGRPVRLTDTGRTAKVIGFTPNGRVRLDSSAYAPDLIARGKAVPSSCLAVARRDGGIGHEGNA